MPADLRALLLEACDLAEMAGLKSKDAERIAELRSLADRPLSVGEALALPEVRDGSHVVELEAGPLWQRQYRFDPSRPITKLMCRGGTHSYINGLPWAPVPFASKDLDAPCALIPSTSTPEKQGGAK